MKIIEQAKKKKVFPSFTPCYFCAFLCVQMCVGASIFLEWALLFFSQSSENLSFYLFLTSQLLERQLVRWLSGSCYLYKQMLRKKYTFSVAGSKQGLKATIPALPFPYHLYRPQAQLVVWLLVHLDILTSL